MDVYCPKCGEPWDTYEFHDIPGMTYAEARTDFRTDGCRTFGSRCSTDKPASGILAQRAASMGVLYDMLGDDFDGIDALAADL